MVYLFVFCSTNVDVEDITSINMCILDEFKRALSESIYPQRIEMFDQCMLCCQFHSR